MVKCCSSGISIATGISCVATFDTFIGVPVSIPLGAASMTGVIASGIISVLTKTYQQKFKKVTKLVAKQIDFCQLQDESGAQVPS